MESQRPSGALDYWMMRDVTSGQHISGTCKMAPGSDPTAVVDQCGRVYGLEGLRVVDASIMPAHHHIALVRRAAPDS